MNQMLGAKLSENNVALWRAHAEFEEEYRFVLLVEDELFVRNVTREILISAGYRVFAATNSIEAMRIYQEDNCQIDLLITDLVLPGETGRSLAERLQRQNQKLKVLFMSGYQNQIELSGPSEKDFLMKPFSSNMLLNRVKLMFDHSIFSRDSETSSRRLPTACCLDDLSRDIR